MKSLSKLVCPRVFYPIWLIAMAVALLWIRSGASVLWLLAGIGVLLVYICRPGSALYTITMEAWTTPKRLCAALVALLTVLACVLPMAQFSLWNGEIPGHRNQYELMAENLLEGRLHFAYGDEDSLAKLDNPYDPEERKEAGVYYHWDHAYYNGQYYMYFGIVPVLLLFLPYRVITGQALVTYQATQIFTALAIVGIFVLFALLAKRFFSKLPFGVYLAMSVAMSVISVWYAAAEPALYCTAIMSAIALEVWSIYCFIRGVWWETKQNRQLLWAAGGALLGALAFGCRPPVALANLLVIPMLITFLRQHRFTPALLGKLVLAALPYVVVAVGLMWYNYVRFGDPFEFGQAYQLTVADQSQYGGVTVADLQRVWRWLPYQFVRPGKIAEAFPYLNCGGAFANFPILLLSFASCEPETMRTLRKERLGGLMIGFAVTVMTITVLDVLWSPYLLERYRMDIYFLMGMACFIAVGMLCRSRDTFRKPICAAMVGLSVLSVLGAALLCCDVISVYYPKEIQQLAQWLMG